MYVSKKDIKEYTKKKHKQKNYMKKLLKSRDLELTEVYQPKEKVQK